MPAHRHPFRGEPVSVVMSSGNIMRARARGLVPFDPEIEKVLGPGYLRVTPTKAKHQRGNVRTTVALAQEGVTWARGWNGPAANALKTVAALREPKDDELLQPQGMGTVQAPGARRHEEAAGLEGERPQDSERPQ